MHWFFLFTTKRWDILLELAQNIFRHNQNCKTRKPLFPRFSLLSNSYIYWGLTELMKSQLHDFPMTFRNFDLLISPSHAFAYIIGNRISWPPWKHPNKLLLLTYVCAGPSRSSCPNSTPWLEGCCWPESKGSILRDHWLERHEIRKA